MASMEVIKKGAVWTIGSGEQVRVWGDSWLPNAPDFRVSTPINLHNAQVSSLMQPGGGGWDVDLVEDIFNVTDKIHILDIKLSFNSREDPWSWSFESKGEYSVKSGYKVYSSLNSLQNGDWGGRCWTALWKLNIPLKVKCMVWRAKLEKWV